MATHVIFDCDGVILQSNTMKSEAFVAALDGYDPALVEEFVAWHKARGGISRHRKFEHFFRNMLGMEAWQEPYEAALKKFGEIVSEGFLTVEHVPGFEAYIDDLSRQGVPMSVNTGSFEEEIHEVFRKRGLFDRFEKVYGSPTSKHENMEKLRADGLMGQHTLYFGDSKLDQELAAEFNLDFIYVGHESEWADGAQVALNTGGGMISDFRALV